MKTEYDEIYDEKEVYLGDLDTGSGYKRRKSRRKSTRQKKFQSHVKKVPNYPSKKSPIS